MTSDADREAFEKWADAHGWRFGRESMAEDAWLAARDHYTAKVRELAEAVKTMQIGSVTSTDLCYIEEVDPHAWDRVCALAAAILNEQEQNDA